MEAVGETPTQRGGFGDTRASCYAPFAGKEMPCVSSFRTLIAIAGRRRWPVRRPGQAPSRRLARGPAGGPDDSNPGHTNPGGSPSSVARRGRPTGTGTGVAAAAAAAAADSNRPCKPFSGIQQTGGVSPYLRPGHSRDRATRSPNYFLLSSRSSNNRPSTRCSRPSSGACSGKSAPHRPAAATSCRPRRHAHHRAQHQFMNNGGYYPQLGGRRKVLPRRRESVATALRQRNRLALRALSSPVAIASWYIDRIGHVDALDQGAAMIRRRDSHCHCLPVVQLAVAGTALADDAATAAAQADDARRQRKRRRSPHSKRRSAARRWSGSSPSPARRGPEPPPRSGTTSAK